MHRELQSRLIHEANFTRQYDAVNKSTRVLFSSHAPYMTASVGHSSRESSPSTFIPSDALLWKEEANTPRTKRMHGLARCLKYCRVIAHFIPGVLNVFVCKCVFPFMQICR